MSLRRMRKGVRAAPGEDRQGTSAVQSHPEATAPTRSQASDTPRVRPESPDPRHARQAASLCREHIQLVLSRILQHEPDGRPDCGSLHQANLDGAPAVPESPRPHRRVPGVPDPSSRRSSPAAGRETADPDSDTRCRRDGAPAMEERSRTRSVPKGCDPRDRPFRLPQHSQHLPFPFRNTRVEVGRPVMEG